MATASTEEIAKKLNTQVALVQKSDLAGFERAYMLSSAIVELNELLTPQYMKPIMALQGNKLGFKTDLDDKDGYPEPIVKRCLIEAVLTGLQPVGNQFNIISGHMYPTKEGCGYLLETMPGLTNVKDVPQLPRIGQLTAEGAGSAAIKMNLSWTYNGVDEKEELDIPIRVNKRMGTDAIIGKARRKAYAWLLNYLRKKKGLAEITDGDVTDVDFKIIPDENKKTKEEMEEERVILLIKNCKSLAKLHEYEKLATTDKIKEALEARKAELMAQPQ